MIDATLVIKEEDANKHLRITLHIPADGSNAELSYTVEPGS
jgi:hypothetical protein